jgi:predicted CXXCH cytochrome family protein
VLRGSGQLLLVCLVIAAAAIGRAGEITVLAPAGPETKLLSRNRILDVIVRVSEAKDLDQLHLHTESGDRVYDPAGRYEKAGVYYVHYNVSLQKGPNRLILDPGRHPINIKYTPLSSLLNLDASQPGLYLFHREEVIPTACRGCHTEELPAGAAVGAAGYGQFSPACYSCHQGKVTANEWKHSPAAALLCRSCHRADQAGTKVSIPAGRVETVCFGCHVNSGKWPAMSHVHGPVGTGDCTICHDPHGSNSQFQLWTDGKAKLCVVCHEDKKKFATPSAKQKLQVHAILSARGCVVCHSPHASNYRFQLMAEINDLCVSCHINLQGLSGDHPVQGHPISGVADPLRPGTEMACTSCHNPHGSEYSYLLIGENRGGLLCAKCHSGPKKPRRSSR